MSSKNIKFVLIGAKATGKTMFIACLQHGTNQKITAVGDVTRAYINEKWQSLNEKDKNGKRRCKLPPTPPKYNPLHFRYQHKEFGQVQFSTHDYDGNFTETIMVKMDKSEEELEQLISQLKDKEVFSKDEEARKRLEDELIQYEKELNAVRTKKQREGLLQSVKEKPNGIFFFLPYERTTERFLDFSQNIGKFIELAQFDGKSKSPIPACIVITKWDVSEGFRAKNEKQLTREYLERNEYLKTVLDMVENYFEYVDVIPVSACESYNLTAPFDFGLEKTFEQWYKRVLELKNEKKFKQLVRYLSNRYEDMKLVEKYDFKVIYDEAQDEYLKVVEKEFVAFENYEMRKSYIDEIETLFGTKPELLEPLKKRLNKELRDIRFKKVGIILLLAAIVVVGIEIKMKFDADEAYSSIKQRYEKHVLYPLMENDIQEFLESYQNVNFLYAFANIPAKRSEVIKMRDNLKVEYKKWIDEKITDILTNQKFTTDEKRLKLKELRSQADTLDQRRIDEMMANLGLSVDKEKWVEAANDCLKVCEGESGKEKITSLIDVVNAGDIVLDATVKELLRKLSQKKSMIIQKDNLDEVLGYIEEQSNANDLIAYLQSLPENIKDLPKIQEKILVKYINLLKDMDIAEILSLFPSMEYALEGDNERQVSQTAIPDDVVASDRFRNALVVALEEKYGDSLMGSGLLDRIKQNRKSDEIHKILEEIKNEIDHHIAFSTLVQSIDNATIEELRNLDDLKKFIKLTNEQKRAIYQKLDEKLTKYVNTIRENMPSDKTETEDTEQKIEEIEKINGFSLPSIGYTYSIPEYIQTQIQTIRDDNEKIKNLKSYGINNVKVTLIGKEDNYIGFECENWSVDNTDIVIEGFDVELKEDDDTSCSDNTMTYPQQVTLKAERYDLTISEDDWVSPDPKFATIYFSIDELVKIDNYGTVTKAIDDGKLQLEFKK